MQTGPVTASDVYTRIGHTTHRSFGKCGTRFRLLLQNVGDHGNVIDGEPLSATTGGRRKSRRVCIAAIFCVLAGCGGGGSPLSSSAAVARATTTLSTPDSSSVALDWKINLTDSAGYSYTDTLSMPTLTTDTGGGNVQPNYLALHLNAAASIANTTDGRNAPVEDNPLYAPIEYEVLFPLPDSGSCGTTGAGANTFATNFCMLAFASNEYASGQFNDATLTPGQSASMSSWYAGEGGAYGVVAQDADLSDPVIVRIARTDSDLKFDASDIHGKPVTDALQREIGDQLDQGP